MCATHSWCLDLEGGAEVGAALGVISSFLKSSLVSLDLKGHTCLMYMHSHSYAKTNIFPIRGILTEQRLCDRPPHDPQGPEDWSNSQLNKTKENE